MRHFNRQSRDYRFVGKIIAGLVLTGSDVKSLRTQGVQFQNASIDILNGQPFLVNLNIPLYKYSQEQTIDTTRQRQLLLRPIEIKKLQSYRKQKYMLIPISIFLSGKWFKVEIGIGRKMRQYEKRQKIRKKEFKQSQ